MAKVNIRDCVLEAFNRGFHIGCVRGRHVFIDIGLSIASFNPNLPEEGNRRTINGALGIPRGFFSSEKTDFTLEAMAKCEEVTDADKPRNIAEIAARTLNLWEHQKARNFFSLSFPQVRMFSFLSIIS